MAAARDSLFPAAFKKVSKKGIPIIGIIISSVLASMLVSMNYSKGLVQMFSFIIMLSTLTCLVPYLLSSLVEIILYLKKRKNYHKKQLHITICISVPAFLYSLWAVSGLGYEIIIWGIILLMVGIPIFVYNKLSNSKK